MRQLILPVEIKNRELDAKLLFACFAAERGYDVVVGQRQAIYEYVLPVTDRSILIEHDVTAAHHENFPRLLRFGHTIVAWDEEVLAQPSAEWYISRRVSTEVMQQTSAHFAWGVMQKHWLDEACPHFAQRIFATGNPRIDLLRPEFSGFLSREAEQYRRCYGDYILINSNFSRANLFHGNREDFIESVAKAAGLNAEQTGYYRDFIAHSVRTFDAYVDMLPALAARFSNRRIIVRPHPAENPEAWARAARGLENVHVLYEGTANGWVAGAAVLLHSGCTTAVEAAIFGIPTIEYAPVHGPQFVLTLPRAVSQLAESFEELCERVEAMLLRDAGRAYVVESARQQLRPYVSALEGPFASEAILDRLAGLEVAGGNRLFRIQKRAYHLLRSLRRKAKRPVSSGMKYAKHKFPPTPVTEVEETVAAFRRISGRFAAVSVSALGNSCFRLQRS